MSQTGFETRLERFLGGEDGRSGHHGATVDDIARLVNQYYVTGARGRNGRLIRWTGAAFDRAPTNDPHRFVDDDRRALRWLSVRMARRNWTAVVGVPALDRELARVPDDCALWTPEAKAAVEDDSAAAALWRMINDLRGFGWVSAHKLLAYKRPKLLPVYDRVVRRALAPPPGRWWLPLWQALQNPGLVERLQAIGKGSANAPQDLSLLRILDVAVWRTQMLLEKTSDKSADGFAAWLTSSRAHSF